MWLVTRTSYQLAVSVRHLRRCVVAVLSVPAFARVVKAHELSLRLFLSISLLLI